MTASWHERENEDKLFMCKRTIDEDAVAVIKVTMVKEAVGVLTEAGVAVGILTEVGVAVGILTKAGVIVGILTEVQTEAGVAVEILTGVQMEAGAAVGIFTTVEVVVGILTEAVAAVGVMVNVHLFLYMTPNTYATHSPHAQPTIPNLIPPLVNKDPRNQTTKCTATTAPPTPTRHGTAR
jgi:hypothetical protein